MLALIAIVTTLFSGGQFTCLMSSRASVVEVSVASSLDYSELLQHLADNVARMMHFDESKAHDIGLAVQEAVTNAMCHGNLLDRTKKVAVRLELHDDRLAVEVDDEGAGFDPRVVPDPCAEENLMKPSGRGILLVKALMDEVEFLDRPGGGTRIRMTKYLTSPHKL